MPALILIGEYSVVGRFTYLGYLIVVGECVGVKTTQETAKARGPFTELAAPHWHPERCAMPQFLVLLTVAISWSHWGCPATFYFWPPMPAKNCWKRVGISSKKWRDASPCTGCWYLFLDPKGITVYRLRCLGSVVCLPNRRLQFRALFPRADLS